MTFPPTREQSLGILREAFRNLDFGGSTVTERKWCDDTTRITFKVARSYYVNDPPDPGWYCVALSADGSVRMYKPPDGGSRQPLAGFTASETEAKEWVEDVDFDDA